jgi:hypothetical protein
MQIRMIVLLMVKSFAGIWAKAERVNQSAVFLLRSS